MKKFLILFSILVSVQDLFSQVTVNSQLYATIKSKDSLLFDIGFNTCNIKLFEELISDDFEFYHDKGGVTSSKAAFIAEVRDGMCKLPYRPKRVLDESTLQVYPLEKNDTLYGALQSGIHWFYKKGKDGKEQLTSTARFTHLWLQEKGTWKLRRVYSYDHREPEALDSSLLFKDVHETEKWIALNNVPALGLGYIRDGKIQELKVYGELEKGVPAPVNALFNVASLTKPITALLTLKLVDAGKWDLDEPLSRYWTDPDVASDPWAKKLTTRHILSHRSGFSNWRYENENGKLAFQFEPGAEFRYSGEGFEYLRKALEKKFGKTLDVLAGEWIFKPLSMNDTRFFWDSSMDESRFAKGHDEGKAYEIYKNTSANAADDLLTTVEDYCRFLVYVLNGAGLSEKLYLEMISEQSRMNTNQYFGLCWWVDENIGGGEIALVHGGDDKGVHTIVFILPQSKQALLIFTNSTDGTSLYIPTLLHYLGAQGQGIIDAETK